MKMTQHMMKGYGRRHSNHTLIQSHTVKGSNDSVKVYNHLYQGRNVFCCILACSSSRLLVKGSKNWTLSPVFTQEWRFDELCGIAAVVYACITSILHAPCALLFQDFLVIVFAIVRGLFHVKCSCLLAFMLWNREG